MVSAERLERRRFVYGKLKEGWQRIATEHPEIDWKVETHEMRRAELRLWHAKDRYETGLGGLAEVKVAFDEWAAMVLRADVEM